MFSRGQTREDAVVEHVVLLSARSVPPACMRWPIRQS